MYRIRLLTAAAATLLSTGCATAPNTALVRNTAGAATIYNDVRESGPIQGVGIESQDIVSMTDAMMRDMLNTPALVTRATPPRIIVDEGEFRNESTSRLNKRIITERLKVLLNRNAGGKLVFVGRQYTGAIEAERAMKRDGVVDGGTIRTTNATAGGDFLLGGTIMSQDAIQQGSGLTSRTHTIIFEMVDLELGTIVWTGLYEFGKTAQDDVLYR